MFRFKVLSCTDSTSFTESILSEEELSKSVPALKRFLDALCDWADNCGAELLTPEVSQPNCAHNHLLHMLMCASILQFGMCCMPVYVVINNANQSCDDDS